MPNLPNLDIEIDVDAVLRGQGADPNVLRVRRPALVNLAEQAIQEAIPLIESHVVYKEFNIADVRHERLLFTDGNQVSGKLIAQHLSPARQIIVIACTIGSSVEAYSEEMWSSSPSYSLALDGVGSAAVEALANAACRHLEHQAELRGWKTSIPLSPGMIDWSVDEGQPQIFRLLDDEIPYIELNASNLMIPKKSLTMLIGAGPEMTTSGRTCDFCNLRDVCRYQEHYR